jgi:hypothetical protein
MEERKRGEGVKNGTNMTINNHHKPTFDDIEINIEYCTTHHCQCATLNTI